VSLLVGFPPPPELTHHLTTPPEDLVERGEIPYDSEQERTIKDAV
jgi:hypothetical protein